MTQTNRLKILILCDFDGRDAAVISDFLYSFNTGSRHDYYYFHNCAHIGASFDFSAYDVIVFFWSCLWFWGMSIHEEAAQNIARSRALKILFLQDEYRTVRINNRRAAKLGVQIVFSCVAEKDFHVFYPRSEIPTLQAVYPVLTGYVPEYMERLSPSPFETRPVDIGYRGRVMSFHLGDLAREKLTIAQQFERVACERGFTADISVREEDRYYGRQWQQFLESCKFVLGTESGASVIDFSGELELRCATYAETHPRAGYEQVRERFLADVHGGVVIQTISPRIFESVAHGNVQVLHEGAYAGMLRPDEHFISVKKDYSNIDEVVERMRDVAFCRRLRDNAYHDLIASGKYSYSAFMRRFDEILQRHVPGCSEGPGPSKARFYVTNYVLRGEGLIPRGNGFVRLPRPGMRRLGTWARAVGEAVPGVLLVLGLLWDVPALARALLACLLRRARRKEIAWRRLWSDLVRLGAIRYVQGGGSSPGRPFRVMPICGEDVLACYLVSQSVDQSVAQVGSPARAQTNAWRPSRSAERWPRLVWDHSAVGDRALIHLGGGKPCCVFLGATGAHWLRGLTHFCQTANLALADVVDAVLCNKASALRRWQALRLLPVAHGFLCRCGHWIRRLLRLPSRFYHVKPGLRLLLVLGLLRDVPALRRSVGSLVVRPWQWRKVGLVAVWRDLLRLSVFRLARSGHWFGGVRFRIDLFWRAHSGTCNVVSEPQETAWPVGASTEVYDALASGRCRRLAWDHSAIAQAVCCGPEPLDCVWFTMGKRGVYAFNGVARMCHLGAEDLSQVLEAVLHGGPCSLQSALPFQLLVFCHRLWISLLGLPLHLVRTLTRSPRTLPQRAVHKGGRLISRLLPWRQPPHSASQSSEPASPPTRQYRKSA
jgi:hypothetical protein